MDYYQEMASYSDLAVHLQGLNSKQENSNPEVLLKSLKMS